MSSFTIVLPVDKKKNVFLLYKQKYVAMDHSVLTDGPKASKSGAHNLIFINWIYFKSFFNNIPGQMKILQLFQEKTD